MVTKKMKVMSEVGLHARPSLRITQIAHSHPRTKILVCNDRGLVADARSILSLLSLGVEGGSTVVVTADGEEETMAIDEVARVIESHKLD